MQIRRFYCPEIPEPGKQAVLPPEEARHALQVLRVTVGDTLVLLDGKGLAARAAVEAAGPRRHDGVTCRILDRESLAPPATRIHLYVAPPRGKAMKQVVRAAVELGVWRIVPILCEYGVRRGPGRRAEDLWTADCLAAMKQSGNPRLPEVSVPLPFAAARAAAPPVGVFGAVPMPGESAFPDLPVATGDVALWIGPEGGFSANEEQSLREWGYMPLAVGRWILRVETAVPVLLGVLLGGEKT